MATARSSDDQLTPPATPVRLLSILVVVGVLVGVAGILVPRLTDGPGSGSERPAVVSRATDFAVTYNTYSVDEKADYQKRMKGLLTAEYYKEFTTVTNAIFDAIEAKDQSSGDAKVLGVAVDSIDGDSAVALVAVNAAIKTNTDESAVERRFRWKVTFTREKGEWLVQQFEAVAPVEATVGEPTATPDPSPSADEESKP